LILLLRLPDEAQDNGFSQEERFLELQSAEGSQPRCRLGRKRGTNPNNHRLSIFT